MIDDPSAPRAFTHPTFYRDGRNRATPDSPANHVSDLLVVAASRHQGTRPFGIYRRLAVLVRGGLTDADRSVPEEEQAGGELGRSKRGDKPTQNKDGPFGATSESRLWERARRCVTRVGSETEGLVFLAKSEGSGSDWYHAIGTLLAVKFRKVKTFQLVAEGVDGPDEVACLLACEKPSYLATFIDCCAQVGLTPVSLASSLRWDPIFECDSEDNHEEFFTVVCPFHV